MGGVSESKTALTVIASESEATQMVSQNEAQWVSCALITYINWFASLSLAMTVEICFALARNDGILCVDYYKYPKQQLIFSLHGLNSSQHRCGVRAEMVS